MNMDDKMSTHLRSSLKAFHHQRGFSDVTTFQFPCGIIHRPTIKLGGGDSCPDIVQLDQEINTTHINNNEFMSSSIKDNDLDYDAFFSKFIDVDNNDQEEKCSVINNLCGDDASQVKQIDVNFNYNQRDGINWVNTPDGDGDGDEDKEEEQQLDRRKRFESPDGPAPSPQHYPNLSVAAGSNIQTSVEAKRAVSAAKLAELWIVDPKRARRIMANRQSAARSKERKARYISELERKVKSLQTEAKALATQLNIYKEDAVHLAAENKELKLRLQTMEHQAHLQDDITEAMMGEVERLRFTTGEIVPSSSLKLGMQSQAHHHLLSPQCSTPAATNRESTSQGLPPWLSCQPAVSHYWPSLH